MLDDIEQRDRRDTPARGDGPELGESVVVLTEAGFMRLKAALPQRLHRLGIWVDADVLQPGGPDKLLGDVTVAAPEIEVDCRRVARRSHTLVIHQERERSAVGVVPAEAVVVLAHASASEPVNSVVARDELSDVMVRINRFGETAGRTPIAIGLRGRTVDILTVQIEVREDPLDDLRV